jgi:hypothetical protein
MAPDRSVQAGEGITLPAGGLPGGVQPLTSLPASGVFDPAAVVDSTGSALAVWQRDDRIEAAALDAVAPRVARPVVGVRAERTVAESFSVTGTDNWGPLSFRWDFGDGSTAEGAGVPYAWRRPGVLPAPSPAPTPAATLRA